MSITDITNIIEEFSTLDKSVTNKIVSQQRLTQEEGLRLFKLDLGLLGILAEHVNNSKNQGIVYFNRNFHIEPTNVCVFSCKFCSYSRLYAKREEGWELSLEDMLNKVKAYDDQAITEVHIVGGVHPKLNLEFFCSLLEAIKAHRPKLHIKAFTAVELDYMFRKAKVSTQKGLQKLKASGLDSLPGGGAEIFNPVIRNQICADKVDGKSWLATHKTAHLLGIPSNATMLYGHIETYEDRIDHMCQLRKLQDETKGFNAFIPLKFWNQDNEMSHLKMTSSIEDLKMYAIARIFMDNFNHIKAYWPMMGKSMSQIAMSFGVNDLDGTIDDSTKIYSMAGAEDKQPMMSTNELVHLIKATGKQAVERNTLYKIISRY